MSSLQLLILGIVVGANNLATAMALGSLRQPPRTLRIVAVFSAFEFVVPLIGLWLGQAVARWIETHATWVAAGLLLALGAWTIAMGIRNRPDDQRLMQRVTSWQGLMLLAATLSLDNLVVGFSLGMRRMDPWIVATTIAVFSAAFTWLGLKLGRAARRRWETYAEVLAGLMLVGLGTATALGWL